LDVGVIEGAEAADAVGWSGHGWMFAGARLGGQVRGRSRLRAAACGSAGGRLAGRHSFAKPSG
jgi:hypothetical protein